MNTDTGKAVNTRPFNTRTLLGVPLFIMLCMALFEPVQLDLWLGDLAYQPGTGFIGANSFFLENILHDTVKQCVIALVAAIALTWLASFVFPGTIRIERQRWLYVVIAMTISGSLVMPLKRWTEVQCPWDLARYGGVEAYSPVMEKRAPVVKHAGKCWPGGHASSGFTLFALFFALRDIRPRAARIALGGAILLGITLSVGRMLQGAHFLSHNVWTALIDWTVCAALYRLMLYRPPQHQPPHAADSATMATPTTQQAGH